jgi:RNA polymerase sigma factor (sigma-70 family)
MPTGQHSISDAIEQALATYAGLIRRVGWQHRLSEADVDELVQDVRIRIWRARGESSEQIREVTSSYMYRTAVSAALDLLRRRRAGRTEAMEPDQLQAQADATLTTSGPADDLAESELAEQIMLAVETIAPARRPVVKMHLAGYGREEIAELLGWTEAKTRNLLYRGLADLRERLGAQGIGWGMEPDDDTETQDRTAIG